MGYGNLEIKRRIVKQEVSNQFEREEHARRILAARKTTQSRDKFNSSKNLHSAGWMDQGEESGAKMSEQGSREINVRRNKELGDHRNSRQEAPDSQNIVFHSSNRAGS